MDRKLTIARLDGIPVDVHASWPPVYLFVTWMLVTHFFPQLFLSQAAASYWIVSLAASSLLFGSLLAHEYCHAFVARRRGLRVHRIGLFFLGGVVEIDVDGGAPIDELLMALAGPAASLILGLAFAAAWLGLANTHLYVGAVAIYLALANVLLAGFNLIPGFPLDGGRVLRASLWLLTRDHDRATRWACGLGQGVAGLGLAFGLQCLATGSLVTGAWLGMVAAFVFLSARTAMPATPISRPAPVVATMGRRDTPTWRTPRERDMTYSRPDRLAS